MKQQALAFGKRLLSESRPLLGAYSALLFSQHIGAGALVLVATFLSPWRGLAGLVAVAVATALARFLGYHSERIRAGYYGYNALLTGLLLSHGHAFNPRLLLLILAASSVSTLLTAVLGDWLGRHELPVLALPFVLVGSGLAHTTLDPSQEPPWLTFFSDLPLPSGSAARFPLLESIGAVVFQPTLLAGMLLLAAAVWASRIVAMLLMVGAAAGILVAYGMGRTEPSMMLASGYNAALTCAAVGSVFFVPGRLSALIGLAAGALSGWVAIAFLAPFAPVSLPVLAWPFVGVTLTLLRGLQLRPFGRRPHFSPLPFANPEANLAFTAATATRLQLPGPPRFMLPCAGDWSITQGFHGAHTHRGDWPHALDLEVLDPDGFPFTGSGARVEDYYCYGKPVLAPGWGTVVAVHNGFPDNPPGSQDLAHPWGNAIVLQHGPSLFSVLAHLRPGTIAVAVGAAVAPGQVLAECGASGRSPRPHLHLQVQASQWLGVPTTEFLIAHYCVSEGQGTRFVRLGVPCEGERVHTPEAHVPLLGFTRLTPGQEIQLEPSAGAGVCLRSELSLLGEQSLLDVTRNERLYFVSHPGGVVFTALEGSPRGALGCLFQLVPSLPAIRDGRVSYREKLPPGPLLSKPLRMAYELCRLLGDPLSAEVSVELLQSEEQTAIRSELEFRALGTTWWRRRGRIVFDAEGLQSVELYGGIPGRQPLFSARRKRSNELVTPRKLGAKEAKEEAHAA